MEAGITRLGGRNPFQSRKPEIAGFLARTHSQVNLSPPLGPCLRVPTTSVLPDEEAKETH